MSEIDPAGDFRVLKMDGMFHVVFRPSADPEWFRIIASFFTYSRAYRYCDVERCMFYDDDSETGDEEKAGLRSPPIQIDTDRAEREFDLPSLVRHILPEEKLPEPLPVEDFSDQPGGGELPEPPEDYHKRLAAEAIAKAADKPTCAKCGEARSVGSASLCRKCYVAKEPDLGDLSDLPPDVVSQLSKKAQGQVARLNPAGDEPLSDKQLAVYDFFIERANPLHLIEASLKEISDGSGVPHGSISFLLETLEKKQLIESVERGDPKRKSVFRVKVAA